MPRNRLTPENREILQTYYDQGMNSKRRKNQISEAAMATGLEKKKIEVCVRKRNSIYLQTGHCCASQFEILFALIQHYIFII